IVFSLTSNKKKVKEMKKKDYELSEKLGLTENLRKRIYEITGGHAQRAAVDRPMIDNPKLVLANDPTGSLDTKSSNEDMSLLRMMNKEEGVTTMLVTHEAQAASYCDRVIFIRDGKLYSEIHQGDSRKVFFQKIIDTLSLMGGDDNDLSSVRLS